MPMALFTVDTTARLFIANPGVTAFDVRVDLYSDAKEHWIDDDQANRHEFPMVAFGGNDIDVGAGTRIPTYAFLRNGWRVRPQEATHTLAVGGGILLVDGGGDPFVNTLAAWTVRILYQQPVQAIAFSTGAIVAPTQQQIRDAMALSSGASESIELLLIELWRMHGLEPGAPLVVSPTSRTVAGVAQTISTVGDTVTVERT